MRRWWTPLIALGLTIHGLHVFGFIIANLVSNQPMSAKIHGFVNVV
jgi:hypothetical protein